jgi:protein-S-isoprenylcysteine O-methyltransferase Ste14
MRNGLAQDVFISLACAFYLGAAWAMGRYFDRSRAQHLGILIVSICGAAFGMVDIGCAVVQGTSTRPWLLTGCVGYMCSLILFWWAIVTANNKGLNWAFSNTQPLVLLDTGPFALVRHPFYWAYSVAWISGFLGTLRVITAVPVVVMTLLYYKAGASEEKLFAQSDLRDDYRKYRATTGVILPRISALRRQR